MVQAERTTSRPRSRKRIVTRKKTTSTLDHVRDGVRRFILSDASIGDFHTALRSAVRTGKLSPNPLTGPALRKIVKEAIDERKSMAKRRNKRKQTEKENRNAKTSNRHH